ncbi:TrkH family potassium uptake protein [Methyloversatilis sp. XJ19-49]|uniref:TrkH family potassium uptake protein n=1 Tax=Methyloversatilis sp. XJ19-49 TaxID=2963429 RepID=UPI00211C750A|nr:potassium transporter TrkG [Methyloversatilis sp. XJ19-49]MCQ9377845.1 TrkH family potassium uptake protein [Methyloversatilis sp. XJ19-49]
MLSVINVLGRLLIVFSAAYLVPIACALIYDDGSAMPFVDGMAISAISGMLLYMGTRGRYAELKPRDGFMLVSSAWLCMAVIATVPFMLTLDSLSFTDALFEAMSSLTTTGATTLVGLDTLPPALNLWRHLLQWLGGMGIIVFAVAILPLLGVGGMQLYKAEMPGPMKENKLTARITDTAKALYSMYIGLTILCILALKLAGMDWIDAICHGFSALGLGGFSTRDASIGAFDSVVIEGVLILFMIFASMNFATHFIAFQRRSVGPYLRDAEAKSILLVLGGSFIGLTLYIHFQDVHEDFLLTARHVAFNLVSIATSSGYASTDYGTWPLFAPLWMLFLGAITASSGSTGGGIKMMRTLVLMGQSRREMVRLIHPAAVHPLRVGRTPVSDRVAQAVLGFIFVYFMSIVLVTFVLLLSGGDFLTAFTAAFSCINNIGPGLQEVGPATNFSSLTDFQTWVCTFAMLLGRLEVFSLLILFTPGFWRK